MAITKTGPALEHGADACEQVAGAIKEISAAAQRVITGPLSMRALCLLIREDLPRGTKQYVSTTTVQEVLKAAAGLDRHVIKKAVR